MTASQFRASREEEGESEPRPAMCLEPVSSPGPLALPDLQEQEDELGDNLLPALNPEQCSTGLRGTRWPAGRGEEVSD